MKALRDIGIGPLIFVAIWLFFMIAGRTRLLQDPGSQWHTVVGERILTQGFTTDEPFSFTKANDRWIPHQWLGEVGMALAYRISGFDTFVLMTATMLAALFTWLILRLLKTGWNPVVGSVISVVMIATAATHIHVRPMLVTIPFLAISAVMLTDYDAGRLKLKQLFWLVPLYLIWSNIHGGMLGGLTSMGLIVAGWIAFKLLRLSSPITAWRIVAWLALLGILCGLTAFATPYGDGIVRVWRTILQQSRIGELIEEHRPLDISQPTSWPLMVLAAFYLFTLTGTRLKTLHVTWLLPLFWLLQAVQHVRHSPLFAVTAFIAITAMWPHTRWAVLLAAKRPDVYDPAHPVAGSKWWAWLFPASVVTLSFLLQATGRQVPVIGAGWSGLDPKVWPTDTLFDLELYEPQDGTHNHILNDCGYGGFLIFQTPGYKVFVDDRAELYGEEFLVEFVRGSSDSTPQTLELLQKQYGVFDFALVKNDSNFDDVLFASKDWMMIHRGDVASFYKRNR